jgi:hypothetical protein
MFAAALTWSCCNEGTRHNEQCKAEGAVAMQCSALTWSCCLPCCSLTTTGPWETDYGVLTPYRANGVYGSNNMFWLDFRQDFVKEAIFKVGAELPLVTRLATSDPV